MRSKIVKLSVEGARISASIPKEYLDKLGGVHDDYEVCLEPIAWDRSDNPIEWCIQIRNMMSTVSVPPL